MNSWYATLQRPPLTPPDWVFGPVWSVLYAMIAVSVALYYWAPARPYIWPVSALLILHLISNFAWTYLFFRLQSPLAALVDILFLDVSLVVLVGAFWCVSTPAAVLLLPYLAWVLFATYLNAGFYRLN
ncbi:MAG: TspO/MBR family protein [bacterium]